MADSSQDNAGPFTMVYHLLAQEVGLVCAAVYGEVKRCCGLKRGVCDASLDTIGTTIHLDRATVMRSIKKLCELGYLIDQTPGRRNAPHTYILSKSVAECNSTSVVMRNSPKESVAEKNKSVAHNNSSIEGQAETVAESHLKRVSSLDSNPKESIKDNLDSSPNGEGRPPLPEEQTVKIEYTPFLRDFLARFNAKRFRNPTQFKTVLDLIEQHGEAELGTLAEWAANKGMGLGQAIPAIKSALTNPKRNKHVADRSEDSTFPPPTDPIPPPILTPAETTWEIALPLIQGTVTKATFDQCIKPLRPTRGSNGTFYLASPTEIDPRLVDKKIEPVLIKIDHNIHKVKVIAQ